ncbi:MAG: hypothetical protein GX256_05750 [Fretibacterium sp.]|nr:hypothetical protein [Fretibacterium sp.]
MRRALILALILAFSLGTLSPREAEGAKSAGKADQGPMITVEAEGFAPVVDGAKNRAREEAKRSLMRAALEEALGAQVTGISEMKDYVVVKDKVFSQTQGLVKDVDILKEWVDEDGVLWLRAICKVAERALDGVLGPALIDALGNPRVMVLLDERIGDKPSFLSTAEGEVLRVFEKAGYLIVDAAHSERLEEADLIAARASGDPEQLRSLARDFNADVLIYGKAYASSFVKQRVSGVLLHGVRSTVQLKAVLATSAYQLGSDVYEEKTKGVSEEDGAIKGLKPGASKAGKSLVHKVAYALVSGSAGGIPGQTIKIKIADISFGDARKLKEFLSGVEGVTGVYQRLYERKTLELDVVSDKSGEDLAGVLADSGWEIETVTTATVEGRGGEGP